MRYHGLDLLRATAMLLGFLLHALLIFDEPEVRAEILPGTEMGDVELSVLGWTVYVWIHIWRMPLFFVLAGFFAAMVIERKGRRMFVKDRAIRIVGALVVFLPMFNLLADAPWGRLDHLWFLWFLVWFSAALVVLHLADLGRLLKPALWIFHSPRRLVWLIVPAVPLVMATREGTIGHEIPAHILEWDGRGVLLYGCAFLLGVGLWHGRAVLPQLARPGIFGATLLVASTAYLVLLAVVTLYDEWLLALEGGAGLAVFAGLGGLSATATLGTVFGLIGLTQFAMPRESRFVSALVALAFPLYLLHLYPVLGLTTYLVEQGLAEFVTIALAIAASLSICLLQYLVFIRYTPLNWVIAGYKKSWFKRPWQQNGW